MTPTTATLPVVVPQLPLTCPRLWRAVFRRAMGDDGQCGAQPPQQIADADALTAWLGAAEAPFIKRLNTLYHAPEGGREVAEANLVDEVQDGAPLLRLAWAEAALSGDAPDAMAGEGLAWPIVWLVGDHSPCVLEARAALLHQRTGLTVVPVAVADLPELTPYIQGIPAGVPQVVLADDLAEALVLPLDDAPVITTLDALSLMKLMFRQSPAYNLEVLAWAYVLPAALLAFSTGEGSLDPAVHRLKTWLMLWHTRHGDDPDIPLLSVDALRSCLPEHAELRTAHRRWLEQGVALSPKV